MAARITVRVCRTCDAETIEISSDSGDSGSKKCKRGYYGDYGGGLAESAFGGSLKPGGWICVAAFGRNLNSVVVKIF
jgi:hypothetical protein